MEKMPLRTLPHLQLSVLLDTFFCCCKYLPLSGSPSIKLNKKFTCMEVSFFKGHVTLFLLCPTFKRYYCLKSFRRKQM
ncbi:hypothetical protein FKM82_019301 [Ascaphus truei]